MPMTTEAALLHTKHQRKEAAFWRRADNCLERGYRPYTRRYERLCYLATMHGNAAHAIYNCPASWEQSETDRKLAEIKAHLGQPLYDEWLKAGAAENFEQYVAEEYVKLFPVTCWACGNNGKVLAETEEEGTVISWENNPCLACFSVADTSLFGDPHSLHERLHDEAGADLQRMNTELRGGL